MNRDEVCLSGPSSRLFPGRKRDVSLSSLRPCPSSLYNDQIRGVQTKRGMDDVPRWRLISNASLEVIICRVQRPYSTTTQIIYLGEWRACCLLYLSKHTHRQAFARSPCLANRGVILSAGTGIIRSQPSFHSNHCQRSYIYLTCSFGCPHQLLSEEHCSQLRAPDPRASQHSQSLERETSTHQSSKTVLGTFQQQWVKRVFTT